MQHYLLFLFIIIIICICFWFLYNNSNTNNTNGYSNKNYDYAIMPVQISLPLTLSDDLFWINLSLTPLDVTNYNNYNFILDSGSDLITIPSSSCDQCTGSRWPGSLTTPIKSDSYQGGQVISYQLTSGFSPTLNQNLQLAVMVDGSSNPDGVTVNLFGLLNPTLRLSYLRVDFPRLSVMFGANAIPSAVSTLTWSSLHRLPYWAIPVQFMPQIEWIILDTGSNYVMIDQSYGITSDFSFNIGNQKISVPANLIRYRPALIPNSIILGNRIMRQYCWLFDLINMRVAIL